MPRFFFLRTLAAGCEFSYCRGMRCFRRLTARIGVHFRIEYENIYIIAGRKYMVETAEADIISPAVATKDPLRTFSKIIVFTSKIAVIALVGSVHFFKQRYQTSGSFTCTAPCSRCSFQSLASVFNSVLFRVHSSIAVATYSPICSRSSWFLRACRSRIPHYLQRGSLPK